MSKEAADPYFRDTLTAVFRQFEPRLCEAVGPEIGTWLRGRRTVARHGTCSPVLYWPFHDVRQREVGIDSVYFTYAVSYDPVRFELDRHDWALVLHLNTVRSYYGPFDLRKYLAREMKPRVPSGFEWQEHPRQFRVIREFNFRGPAEALPEVILEPLTRMVRATHPVLARLYSLIEEKHQKGNRHASDVPDRAKPPTAPAANPDRKGPKAEWSRGIFAALRDEVIRVHGMTCHLCSKPINAPDDLHIDHVVPWAEGGTTTLQNLRPAHARCNLAKGAGGKVLPPEQRSPAKKRPNWRRFEDQGS